MGRFRQMTTEEGGESGIDISPLMDCVFILLIFFIVTTTFVEETGVEVDKPQAASSVRLEKTSILIALTEKGEVVYGGREIGFSGIQPLVKRMLQKEEIQDAFYRPLVTDGQHRRGQRRQEIRLVPGNHLMDTLRHHGSGDAAHQFVGTDPHHPGKIGLVVHLAGDIVAGAPGVAPDPLHAAHVQKILAVGRRFHHRGEARNSGINVAVEAA